MIEMLALPAVVLLGIWLVLFTFSAPPGRPVLSPCDRQRLRCLRLVGLLVLAAALCAASFLTLRADSTEDTEGDVIGYEVGFGYSYPIRSTEQKKVEEQMKQIGGKSNLLATDMISWFRHRWRGTRLPWTVAFLGCGAWLLISFVARVLTYPAPREKRGVGQIAAAKTTARPMQAKLIL